MFLTGHGIIRTHLKNRVTPRFRMQILQDRRRNCRASNRLMHQIWLRTLYSVRKKESNTTRNFSPRTKRFTVIPKKYKVLENFYTSFICFYSSSDFVTLWHCDFVTLWGCPHLKKYILIIKTIIVMVGKVGKVEGRMGKVGKRVGKVGGRVGEVDL